jgi:hypothetical protein
VTSCCNAASSPGASQQSWVPPSLDVPSGNTLGSITHEATSARRRQIPRQPDSWLVSTRILRPQHATGQPGGGSRLPTVPLRSTAARLAATPTAKDAPRHTSGIVRRPPLTVSFLAADSFAPHNHRRASHHASGLPRFPSRCVRNGASSKAEMSSEFSPRAAVSGRYGVKRCPRHSRRFRTPKVVCAAWSFLRERLTPRPTTAKSLYRLLWSANFVRLQEEQLVSG